MNQSFKYILCICFCLFLGMSIGHAQGVINDLPNGPDIRPTLDPNDPNVITNTSPDAPNSDWANFTEQMAQENQELVKQQTTQMLNRRAEEAVYKQRGLTMDFLNKPIELFKLTCTDGGGSNPGVTNNKLAVPSFDFTQQVWEAFCNDPSDLMNSASVGQALAQAGKCMLQQFLRQQFQQVIKTINKFKDMTFCEAFTTFANNQLNQCIKVRFDLPRGQFPGFPALNQCLFGKLNLTVNGKGVFYKDSAGQLQRVVDSYSAHTFKYASVGQYSPNGFGGSESQLLGNEGASALMNSNKWRKPADQLSALKGIRTAGGSTCENVDPDLVEVLKKWPSPTNMLIGGIVVVGRNAKGEERMVGGWHYEVNTTTDKKEAVLSPAGGDLKFDNGSVLQNAGGWSVKPGYTYLASCYGFNVNLDSTTCSSKKDASGKETSASFELMCDAKDPKYPCCNPDETNCPSMNQYWDDDLCKTWTKDATGKSVAPCLEYYHRTGDIHKPEMCAGSCCNPAVNDCLQLATENPGLEVCPQYVPAKQCLTATPEQLAALDPAYSTLAKWGVAVKANQMIDGRACCLTEWCNLCPQDIIIAGGGGSPPNGVYVKESELVNVPAYCRDRDPKYYAGTDNTYIPNALIAAPDQVFDNTQEACRMMQPAASGGPGWDANQVFKIFIVCPSMQTTTGFSLVDGIANWINNGINNCPEGGQVKPYLFEVVNGGACGMLASISKYPMPIDKIPKVEGADAIGLCGDLPLCPAAIPPEQDPLSTGSKKSLFLQNLKGKGGLEGVLEAINGTKDGVPPSLRTFSGGSGILRGLGTNGIKPVVPPIYTRPTFPSRGVYNPPATTNPVTPSTGDTTGGTVDPSGNRDCNQLDALGFNSC